MTTTTSGQIAALRAEADRLEAAACTGLTATWCPTHGDCTCPELFDAVDEQGRGIGEPQGRDMNDERCPLHATASSHGEATR